MFPDILTKKAGESGSLLGNIIHKEKSEKAFSDAYIDLKEFKVKNVDLFKNRIIGLVSFFNEISGIDERTGSNIFPDRIDASPEETTVYMSDYQFVQYYYEREYERILENKAKKMLAFSQKREIAGEAGKDTSSVFRVFSRQHGLFVFPPGINRPRRSREEEIEGVDLKLKKSPYEKLYDKLVMIYKSNKSDVEKLFEYEKMMTGEKMEDFIVGSFIDVIQHSEPVSFNEFMAQIEIEDEEGEVNIIEKLSYEEEIDKAVNRLDESNLTMSENEYSLGVLSPKYAKILENVDKTPGLVLCYSQFLSSEGLQIFSRVLDANGYSPVTVEGPKSNMKVVYDDTLYPGVKVRYSKDGFNWGTYMLIEYNERSGKVIIEGIEGELDREEVYKCHYALYPDGDIPRNKIIEYFTKPNNKWGQKCLIFMITKAGAEGLNLFNIRQVHIMEPYWNNILLQQVIGRARRTRSHVTLPKDQQNVKVYNYIIKYTKEQLNGRWGGSVDGKYILNWSHEGMKMAEEEEEEEKEEDLEKSVSERRYQMSAVIGESDEGMTSDEVLTEIANKKAKILNDFLKIVQESAIDCDFNLEDNIRSDSKFTNLRCYNLIRSPDNYTYPLVEDDTISGLQKEILAERVVIKTKHRIELEYMVRGIGKVHIIVQFDEKPTNIMESIKRGQEVYDYYKFHGLDGRDISLKGQLIKVGEIKEGMSIVFTPEFNDNIEEYLEIEVCMRAFEHKYGKKAPLEEGRREEWAEEVRACRKARKMVGKSWRCLMCNSEYGEDIENCPKEGCEKFDKELYKAYDRSLEENERVNVEEPVVVEEKPKKKIMKMSFD